MLDRKSSAEILHREYLELRAKLIDLAACLDRVHCAEGSPDNLPLWQQIRAALPILLRNHPSKVEEIQRILSRDYDPKWREKWGI